jgi:hypothetical protein
MPMKDVGICDAMFRYTWCFEGTKRHGGAWCKGIKTALDPVSYSRNLELVIFRGATPRKNIQNGNI